MPNAPKSRRKVFISRSLFASLEASLLKDDCLSCASEDLLLGFSWAQGRAANGVYAYVAMDRPRSAANSDLYLLGNRVIFVELLAQHRDAKEPLYLYRCPEMPGKIGEGSALDAQTKAAGELFDEALPIDLAPRQPQ